MCRGRRVLSIHRNAACRCLTRDRRSTRKIGRGASMTRRLLFLLLALAVISVIAPSIAPYDPEVQHRDYLFAPPMLPRIVDESGLRAPFVHPIRLVDRLSQQYTVQREQSRPLPWFDDVKDPPVFLLGADSYGRDLLSRL